MLFTARERLSIHHFVCVLLDRVNYYSSDCNIKEFLYYRKPTTNMVNLASGITKANFTKLNESSYSYISSKHYEPYTLTVKVHSNYKTFHLISCTCISYYRSFICKHCVALSREFDFNISIYYQQHNCL